LTPLNKKYVRERTAQYGFLKSYLDSRGYRVYPSEIIIGLKDIPHKDEGFFADVAAFKNGHYYAFEYKSNGDQLLRSLKQIDNYALSFDYVVVVAEVPRHDISVNLSRGVRIKEILKTGAGFWTVQHNRSEPWFVDADPLFGGKTKNLITHEFSELVEPKLQHPNLENKHYIEQKFKRYVFGLPVPDDPNQKTITSYLY